MAEKSALELIQDARETCDRQGILIGEVAAALDALMADSIYTEHEELLTLVEPLVAWWQARQEGGG